MYRFGKYRVFSEEIVNYFLWTYCRRLCYGIQPPHLQPSYEKNKYEAPLHTHSYQYQDNLQLTTSTPPNSATALSTTFSTLASTLTSPTAHTTPPAVVPPSALFDAEISLATWAIPCKFDSMSLRTMLKPSEARRSAIARPIPCPAPVIMAVRGKGGGGGTVVGGVGLFDI